MRRVLGKRLRRSAAAAAAEIEMDCGAQARLLDWTFDKFEPEAP